MSSDDRPLGGDRALQATVSRIYGDIVTGGAAAIVNTVKMCKPENFQFPFFKLFITPVCIIGYLCVV